mgnify:FL=1
MMFLMILSSVILMNSCKKPATVVVQNNVTPVDYGYGLNSTLYNANLMLYNGSDFIGEIALGDITPGGGKSQIVELEDNVEKVKVRFNFLPSYQTQFDNPIKYTAQFYLINANEENEITLTDETLVSNSPDKKGEVKVGDILKKIK